MTDIKSLNYDELVTYMAGLGKRSSGLRSYISGCMKSWQTALMNVPTFLMH